MLLRRVLVACALLARSAQPAAAAWFEARSSHFIIYSEQKPSELQRYAEDLERFDRAVRTLGDTPDPALSDNGKLVIYVLENADAVSKLVGRPHVAGFYTVRPSGARAFANHGRHVDEWDLSAQSVFFHEYLHHLTFMNSSLALPGWLTEGMAEFFSTAEIRKDGSMLIGRPPLHRAYGLLVEGGLSIDRLVGAETPRTWGEEDQLYGRGWLLTHLLTFERERRGQLTSYIAAIQKGTPPLEAARSAFGDLKKLDRDMGRYLEQRRLQARIIPAATINPGPITVRPLSAANSAVLATVIRTERGVGAKDAASVLAEAQKVAKQFPDDPAVLAELAEAQQDADQNAAAIATADKVLAREPRSSKALVVKARAMLAEAYANPAKADWRAIRADISRANKLDPDHAEPLMMFYETYLAQGLRPTTNSIDGLAYAQMLLPQSEKLRILLVRQRLLDGDFEDAARLYTPIAYDPHGGTDRARRLQLMAALRTGNTAQARALLENRDEETAAAR